MKTIELLRELATAGTSPQWDREIRNALPALLAVVEAQAAEIEGWRQNDSPGERPEDLYARCDRTDDARRKLDEVTL